MQLLLQGLHKMSLLKSVPEGLKPQECERTKLRVPPPVSYVPMKDEVQEEVAKLRNFEIKISIKKDTTLNFPVWHENGTREAFLMHVTAVLDVIKKHGHFQDYEKAEKVQEEAKKAIESARAALSLLDGTGMKAKRFCKKKTREAAEKALASPRLQVRSQRSQGSFQGKQQFHEGWLPRKSREGQASPEYCQGRNDHCRKQDFHFLLELASLGSKYLWNKIVSKQTDSDLYINLQGDFLEGPRGISCKLFNNCIMFHLLTVFLVNTAEQE